MRIFLIPIRMDATLSLVKAGDVLTINGEAYDFSVLPNGGTLPVGLTEGPDGEQIYVDAVGCPYIDQPVHRIDGEIHLTLRLPFGPASSQAARNPAPIIDPQDGPVVLPE